MKCVKCGNPLYTEKSGYLYDKCPHCGYSYRAIVNGDTIDSAFSLNNEEQREVTHDVFLSKIHLMVEASGDAAAEFDKCDPKLAERVISEIRAFDDASGVNQTSADSERIAEERQTNASQSNLIDGDDEYVDEENSGGTHWIKTIAILIGIIGVVVGYIFAFNNYEWDTLQWFVGVPCGILCAVVLSFCVIAPGFIKWLLLTGATVGNSVALLLVSESYDAVGFCLGIGLTIASMVFACVSISDDEAISGAYFSMVSSANAIMTLSVWGGILNASAIIPLMITSFVVIGIATWVYSEVNCEDSPIGPIVITAVSTGVLYFLFQFVIYDSANTPIWAIWTTGSIIGMAIAVGALLWGFDDECGLPTVASILAMVANSIGLYFCGKNYQIAGLCIAIGIALAFIRIIYKAREENQRVWGMTATVALVFDAVILGLALWQLFTPNGFIGWLIAVILMLPIICIPAVWTYGRDSGRFTVILSCLLLGNFVLVSLTHNGYFELYTSIFGGIIVATIFVLQRALIDQNKLCGVILSFVLAVATSAAFSLALNDEARWITWYGFMLAVGIVAVIVSVIYVLLVRSNSSKVGMVLAVLIIAIALGSYGLCAYFVPHFVHSFDGDFIISHYEGKVSEIMGKDHVINCSCNEEAEMDNNVLKLYNSTRKLHGCEILEERTEITEQMHINYCKCGREIFFESHEFNEDSACVICGYKE